ncbi:hypothetical protein TNCT_475821 [Trichonephila clavata]|uniref:Uncharacterized protein n=1 Tax=Trichonephila clavata TaxID=2740835 RepID=A0A8X6J8S3_TRICU|nr:hypothetical protein TNCT_475821 [Trichonephila clavata]
MINISGVFHPRSEVIPPRYFQYISRGQNDLSYGEVGFKRERSRRFTSVPEEWMSNSDKTILAVKSNKKAKLIGVV